MTTDEKGKFGEPWTDFTGGIYGSGLLVIRSDGFVESYQRERAVSCVNALAGISDPAAFVKSVEELCIATDWVLLAAKPIHEEWLTDEAYQDYKKRWERAKAALAAVEKGMSRE